MKELLQSLAKLGALAVLAGLVLTKVSDTFPQLDGIGWVITVAGFVAIVALSVQLDNLVEKKGRGWLNGNETRRQYLIMIGVAFLIFLLFYFLWPMIGSYISPHFGQAV